MGKSLLLKIFRLITPDDLGVLAETLEVSHLELKKAAGSELLSCDSEPHPSSKNVSKNAKVIQFPKKDDHEETIVDKESLAEIGVLSGKEQRERKKVEEEEEKRHSPSESDLLLEEREKFKESEEKIYKRTGFACYQRSSDLSLYRVTSTDTAGKEKSRLTSSQGVLVNKKQA